MRDALMLTAAVAASGAGLAWFALAMDVHWHQVRGESQVPPGTARVLRVLGVLGVCGSLALCLAVDHATMASLVWFMALAGSALLVAFTLTWRPRALCWLVVWAGSRATA